MAFLYFILFFLNSFTTFFKSPINLCISVVISNILLSRTLYFRYRTWLYLTFSIIYIGAIIVIFAYFSAITSTLSDSALILNEKIIVTSQIFPIWILIFNINPNIFPQIRTENYIINLYSHTQAFLLTFLFIVLYFTIVLVSKVVENIKASLRPWNWHRS